VLRLRGWEGGRERERDLKYHSLRTVAAIYEATFRLNVMQFIDFIREHHRWCHYNIKTIISRVHIKCIAIRKLSGTFVDIFSTRVLSIGNKIFYT
jgi:hypothetical protein